MKDDAHDDDVDDAAFMQGDILSTNKWMNRPLLSGVNMGVGKKHTKRSRFYKGSSPEKSILLSTIDEKHSVKYRFKAIIKENRHLRSHNKERSGINCHEMDAVTCNDASILHQINIDFHQTSCLSICIIFNEIK